MNNKLNVLDYLIKNTNDEIEYINNFRNRKEAAKKKATIKMTLAYIMNG